MLISFRPLKKYPNYRYLFIGQLVSTLGSMITYVALPYQVFQISHSSLAVGMMGVIELVPLLFTALVGGVYADRMDRKKLLIYSELGLASAALILVLNASASHPQLWILYGVAGISSALNGFHRPALEALTPKLVAEADIASLSPLNSMKGLIGTVGGPALGGICIASLGLGITYFLDFCSFLVSLLALLLIRSSELSASSPQSGSTLDGIGQGFKYAWSRPELIGSYLIDFIAMIFGMPIALFPALSESFGGVKNVGFFYAAPSVGAMIATLFSGWSKEIRRSGVAISCSALVWGLGITFFGFSKSLPLALFFLALAGAADAMSGVFRISLWNQTIPDRLRGRLAGVEMISYMSGPLLGHAESGLVAAGFGNEFSVISGGLLCIAGVGLSLLFLPTFWKYKMPLGKREI